MIKLKLRKRQELSYEEKYFYDTHPTDEVLFPDEYSRFVCSGCWWGNTRFLKRCPKCYNGTFLDLRERMNILTKFKGERK